MLEPRETNIPALFLVLVVFPLVLYILLGKWGEAAKKRERVSLLSQLASEETVRARGMAGATVMPQTVRAVGMAGATVMPQVSYPINEAFAMPHFPASKSGHHHVCARCFAPAKTRCSRCKSARYCSGNCQIIHWRQVHKHECYPLETSDSNSSSGESGHGWFLLNDSVKSQLSGYVNNQIMMRNPPSDAVFSSTSNLSSSLGDCSTTDTSQVNIYDKKENDKWQHCSNIELVPREDVELSGSSEEASETVNNRRDYSDVVSAKERSKKLTADSSNSYVYGQPTLKSTLNEGQMHQTQKGAAVEPRSGFGYLNPPYILNEGMNIHAVKTNIVPEGGDSPKEDNVYHNETNASISSEIASKKGSLKAKSGSHHLGNKTNKLPKSNINISGRPCSGRVRPDYVSDKSKSKGVDTHGKRSSESMEIMRTMGLKKQTRCIRRDETEINVERCRKIKMLFPYEEFVKYFQCEVYGISPRGLLNCGNSCYANAVLQCLTCTKPLVIYLLHRSHSRTCCKKDWCLMCELEEYAMLLREIGGPLSPSRILFHIRNINCQLGNGSQEDAHEFLRLLIASMQSICLERLGGESRVNPRLQETTFVQHTFGGRLLSKVHCLRCHHESERYENIMDLTLEIFGWVESLEDALTQFTTPEDLDGENMYRCGRCAAYVRARKQLSIHEAPNILTIVLKRFQEGKYGKINKCIAFPDMLDMDPFMTGTSDIPPLYSLYGVVVHLDTLNASFSGHYVSYVKDLQGNWFRIDDIEVQPVSIGQVMSEGAYILFYMRSLPRPQGKFSGKNMQQPRKTEKPSRLGQSQQSVAPELLSYLHSETMEDFPRKSNGIVRSGTYRNVLPPVETFAESSDWSIFTSSDEASFTTESTRDSFSTVDYADACNTDPLSIFSNLYGQDYPGYKSLSYRKNSSSRAETRFLSEEKGYVLESCAPSESKGRSRTVESAKESINTSPDVRCESNCSMSVKYGIKPKHGTCRTCKHD